MQLLYSGLKESKVEEKSWDKKTVQWVLANESKVKQFINNIGYKMRNSQIQKGCVEDIYHIVLVYFYKSKDYDVEKANSGDREVSIDGYIFACVRGCVLNYMTTEIGHEVKSITVKSDSDGEVIDVWNKVSDARAESEFSIVENDLYAVLKAYRYKQYRFGVDMYRVVLIRLLLSALDKPDSDYFQIMEIMDINIQNLKKAESKAASDDMMKEIVSCVIHMDVWKAIDIVKENVHCGSAIVDMIANK